MNENQKRILEMLAQGKVSVSEAEKLLGAMAGADARAQASEASMVSGSGSTELPRYLRVTVEPKLEGAGDRVQVRVPLRLVRAGMRLAALIPADVQSRVNEALRDKGIGFDLSKLTPENIDDFLRECTELTVDVDNPTERVRVFFE